MRQTIIRTVTVTLIAALILTGCSFQPQGYFAVPDERWSLNGKAYEKEGLLAAANAGPVEFSFAADYVDGTTGLLLGTPYIYTWIRLSAKGKSLYEAGSKERKALCAAPRFALLSFTPQKGDRVEIDALLKTRNGVARPYAALGNERALLEAAAKKSALRIALSALNLLLFGVFAFSFALRRRSGFPSRTITFGFLNLALALVYSLGTPLFILYARNYWAVSLLEDCAYFFLTPLVLAFITETVFIRNRFVSAAKTILFIEASCASGFSILSITFFSGAFYAAIYIASDILSIAICLGALIYLAPRAFVRKKSNRLVAAGILVFAVCAALDLVYSDFSNRSTELAIAQIGFFAMTAALGMTAIGRFDRLKWRLEDLEKNPEQNQPSGAITSPIDGTRPDSESACGGESASARRRRKIAADENLHEKISYLLDVERVWNEDSLTLPQFADLVGAPPHDVTLFVNEQFGDNFTAVINGRRMEEAKRLLAETDYTVLRVALESGFSSKSAFYRCFREAAKISPVEFRLASKSPKARSAASTQGS